MDAEAIVLQLAVVVAVSNVLKLPMSNAPKRSQFHTVDSSYNCGSDNVKSFSRQAQNSCPGMISVSHTRAIHCLGACSLRKQAQQQASTLAQQLETNSESCKSPQSFISRTETNMQAKQIIKA